MKKLSRSEHFQFLILMTVALVIGVITFRSYGESWDELNLYKYAEHSLEAYVAWPLHGVIPVTGDRFENYGPAFVMFTAMVTKAFTQNLRNVQAVDIQHFVYFLTFLVGVWAFYQLATRWMSHTGHLAQPCSTSPSRFSGAMPSSTQRIFPSYHSSH